MNLRSLATDPKLGGNKEETKWKRERGREKRNALHYIEQGKVNASGEKEWLVQNRTRRWVVRYIYIHRNQVCSVLTIVFSFPISPNPHEDTSDNIALELLIRAERHVEMPMSTSQPYTTPTPTTVESASFFFCSIQGSEIDWVDSVFLAAEKRVGSDDDGRHSSSCGFAIFPSL